MFEVSEDGVLPECGPFLQQRLGARTEIFPFDGIQGQQKAYLEWLLNQCTRNKAQTDAILTDEALELLTQSLVTPLQINHYLTLALEEAYQIGQKPVSADIVGNVLSITLNDPEPHLIRHGYNALSLARLINVKPAEIRAFLHSQLSLLSENKN